MNKKVFFILVFLSLFFISPNFIFSTNVEITSNVYLNKTFFNYIITFGEGEEPNTFSLEKPKGSVIVYARDYQNNSLEYSVAGDYFIFLTSKEIKNSTFYIKFYTTELSSQIKNKNLFNVYFNFNFPVDNLKFNLIFEELNKNIVNLLPRNYNVYRENEYIWELTDIKKDTFFSITFDSDKTMEINRGSFFEKYMFTIYFFSFLFLLVLVYLILKLINKLPTFSISSGKSEENNNKEPLNGNENNKNEVLKPETKEEIKKLIIENQIQTKEKGESQLKSSIQDTKHEENNKDLSENNNDNNTNYEEDNFKVTSIVEKKDKKEEFSSFIEKYLTENEKIVVTIISSNQGITQNEILNHLPSMKKSNLSKIITKLDGKKILNKVRVGKITKIYFGEKLEKFNEED